MDQSEAINSKRKHTHVVIIGGGFGGVQAALKLANVVNFTVTLISNRSYFEYHAALYRSATGRSPLEEAIPLTDFFLRVDNVEVVDDTITDFDLRRKSLSGKSGAQYHYDVLIFAVGSVTQYFGIKGLDKYSYSIKSIQEALALKRHLYEDLINNRPGERNYIIVGGGATGVELAGELPSYLEQIRRGHRLASYPFTIDLIEASAQLLPGMNPNFSQKVQQRLSRLGVNVILNTAIKAESFDAIKLPNGSIKTHVVIWTAGVANNRLLSSSDSNLKIDKHGKIIVNNYLASVKNVYMIGDCAATLYSGMAQTALHEGKTVAINLIRQSQNKQPLPYKPLKPVYAIPVGPHWAATEWRHFRFYGRPGWIIRRLADLRLYLTFLPTTKALRVWHYGLVKCEVCPNCRTHL